MADLNQLAPPSGPATGIGQLFNNIVTGIGDLVNRLLGQSKNVLDPFPNASSTFPNILTNINTNKANWNKNFPYVFSVVDITNTNNSPSIFIDFPLPLNPQAITQDETYSIVIKPTQGGTTVTYAGNRYRDLVISGTTGNFPFAPVGVDHTGAAILQPTDIKHSSGYATFQALRNYFRAFYEYKFGPVVTPPLSTQFVAATAKNLHLIFRNYKDGEFSIVELTKFSMKRAAGRPFMYDYNITMRVIGTLAFQPISTSGILSDIDSVINTATDVMNTAKGLVLTFEQIVTQITSNINSILNPMTQLTLLSKAIVNGQLSLFDFPTSVLNSFVDSFTSANILSTIQNNQTQEKAGIQVSALSAQAFLNIKVPSNISQAAKNNPVGAITALGPNLQQISPTLLAPGAIQQIQQQQQMLLSSPREGLQNSIKVFINTMDNAADLFGLSDPTYNQIFERTQTLTPQPNVQLIDSQFLVLYGFQQAIMASYALFINPALFNSTYNQSLASLNADFNNNLNLQPAQAVMTTTFPGNTTLERFAEQQLGDANRWVEIATLNNLVEPYVSNNLQEAQANPGTTFPGAPILVPTKQTSGFTTLPQVPLLPQFAALPQVAKNLGLDLKITPNFDLEIDNSNDIKIVSGLANLQQAVMLKLAYEKGDLLHHPEIGVGLDVGSVVQPVTLIQSAIVNTLLTDPRISTVQNLTVLNQDNTTRISFTVIPKNYDSPLPITLVV